ncbi:FG-GAP-like repeat-containing protein [Streptomyces sp. NPDC097619]|uniref:FG-GAP-like repeat-containing protein n=1 Tax=Streptomyces sp. NPDC097619 TaxID=3157228 RepID=UPI00331E4FCA
MSFIKRALAATAATVALAVTGATAGTATAAGNPAGTGQDAAAAQLRAAVSAPAATAFGPAGDVATPTFPMTAIEKKSGSRYYLYEPNGDGGFAKRKYVGDFDYIPKLVMNVDHDRDGLGDGSWFTGPDGVLYFFGEYDIDANVIGRGWNAYTKVLSPGTLGGAKEADILAVDKAGVLWLYLGYVDGRVTSRIKVGAGWGGFTQIAGQGDLTMDGKADIVARDKAGVLWLYAGTGNPKAPFAAKKKIGAGWNGFDRVFSIGDLDFDGVSDLIARTPKGDLMRYSGTGNASIPFAKPVKIGTGYQIYSEIR